MDNPADFQVHDCINNCRFCFKPFIDNHKAVEITDTIEQKFFELTQFQLIQDEAFSNVICILCHNDLELFSNYRHNLLEKQKKLYQINFKQYDDHLQLRKICVKEEIVEEFVNEDISIDCLTVGSYEDNQLGGAKNKQFKNEADQVFNDIAGMLKTAPSKLIRCPECCKLLNHNSLKEHFYSAHILSFKKFHCDFCSFEASRRSQLLLHLENQHEMEVDAKMTTKAKKRCNYCGAMVKDWRRHILKVHLHIKKFFCDSCPYGAFFKYDLEQHMKTHVKKLKEPEKFFCEMCGLEFEKRFHLNAHVKAKHTVKERIHQCTVCAKKNLKKHAESHDEKTKPCEFCGKLFSCMNNLRTHLYYHAEPKFTCDVPNCGKKFFMRKRLRAHHKSHRGQKDFECEVCKKCYFSQNDLNRHTFSIHDKFRFFCQVSGCNGNFSRREYYKKHALQSHKSNLGAEDLEKLLQDIKVALPSRAS